MKTFLSAVLLVVCVSLFGQQQDMCYSPGMTYSQAVNSNPPIATPVYLRIYVHIIRDDNGLGGQSIENVMSGLCNLRQDFAPHGIFFDLQSINYIDETQYYDFELSHLNTVSSAYGHTDGIDIFLYEDVQPNLSGGYANGIGTTTYMFVGGIKCAPAVQHHIISHEMGHVLNLHHTHEYFDGNQIGCAENVVRTGPNANCITCGDKLCDTPADPDMDFMVDPVTCTWQQSKNDPFGDPYDPDETNIMSYSCPPCMTTFSPQQVSRMLNFLGNTNNTGIRNCINSTSIISNSFDFDLMIRDIPEDIGQSPSPGIPTDDGPDIWVRQTADGLTNQQSEPIEYAGSNFYAYVRVLNKGCTDFTGGGTLDLHWSKMGTAQAWPTEWNGTTSNGNLIASLPIPAIPAGGSHIFEIPWDMSGNLSSLDGNNVHACLLARIEGVVNDPTNQPGISLYTEVKTENNLSMKNLVIQNASYFKQNHTVGVYFGGNELGPGNYNFGITGSAGNTIFEDAEIRVQLDQIAWDKWEAAGFQNQYVDIIDPEEHIVLFSQEGATIYQLHYLEDERSQLDVAVHFLVEETTTESNYRFNFVQETSQTASEHYIIGTAGFLIVSENRSNFNAEAGNNASMNYGDTIQITAQQINEAATYNWYNAEGELVHTGSTLAVSPEVSETYTLEVIADADGYIDYDEVEVEVQPLRIESINPNPVSTSLTVNYQASNAQSAYLMLVEQQSSQQSNNYLIQPQQTQTVLDVSSLAAGNYTLALVCDGVIVDAINLIIQ